MGTATRPQSTSKPQRVPPGSVPRRGATARHPTTSEALGLQPERPEPGRCQPLGTMLPTAGSRTRQETLQNITCTAREGCWSPPSPPSLLPRRSALLPPVRMSGSQCLITTGGQILRRAGTCGWELVPRVLEPREGRSRGTASAAARSPAGRQERPRRVPELRSHPGASAPPQLGRCIFQHN